MKLLFLVISISFLACSKNLIERTEFKLFCVYITYNFHFMAFNNESFTPVTLKNFIKKLNYYIIIPNKFIYIYIFQKLPTIVDLTKKELCQNLIYTQIHKSLKISI